MDGRKKVRTGKQTIIVDWSEKEREALERSGLGKGQVLHEITTVTGGYSGKSRDMDWMRDKLFSALGVPRVLAMSMEQSEEEIHRRINKLTDENNA